jgi:hypothetical protein
VTEAGSGSIPNIDKEEIMKLKMSPCAIALMGWSAVALAGMEGNNNTFYGTAAGFNTTTALQNTFVGAYAGYITNSGTGNSVLGYQAGFSNTTGGSNTVFGWRAGYNNMTGTNNTVMGVVAGYQNTSGSGNVFVGYGAGNSETGSNRLYIDNCVDGGACSAPLIYGQFDNRRLRLNGMTEVHYNGQPKSQLNFSQWSTDTGGYLTSVQDNNFFVSSGARFDGTLTAPNQWVQRSSDDKSVIQGSGGLGYRVFLDSSHAVNQAFNPTVRLWINYNGEFGINTAPVAGREITTGSGAYLAAGTWTNASSRALKERIEDLSLDAAKQALAALQPVTFNYKADARWQHVGFIAEDVPDLVASPDRKGLSAMDIVAVLTKVMQEQTRTIEQQGAEVVQIKQQLLSLSDEMRRTRKTDAIAGF